jgi:hypothetical protein
MLFRERAKLAKEIIAKQPCNFSRYKQDQQAGGKASLGDQLRTWRITRGL